MPTQVLEVRSSNPAPVTPLLFIHINEADLAVDQSGDSIIEVKLTVLPLTPPLGIQNI
jgi:hypothetical protein